MNEIVWHVVLIWILLSITLVLFYEKLVVQRQMDHNMYTGKGQTYNKKKARSSYLAIVIVSAVIAFVLVKLLAFLA
ncbi:MAG: hypothetical protein ACO1O1_17175 [Adhaeribacter sp.]